MGKDISITAEPFTIELPETVVSDVNALEKRGGRLITTSAAGFSVAAAGAVGTALWWWLVAPSIDVSFHSVDLPASIEALKSSGNAIGDGYQSVTSVLAGWMGGTLGHIVAFSMITYGLFAGLFKQSVGSAVTGIAGGMVLMATPTIVLNTFGDPSSGASGSAPVSIERYLDNKSWMQASELLANLDSVDAAYVDAQIAYVSNNLPHLQTLLPKLDERVSVNEEAVKPDHLYAMEKAAYGHAVSETAANWSRVTQADRDSTHAVINGLYELEGAASFGFLGAFSLGIWMRRRATRLKELASQFTPQFLGWKAGREEPPPVKRDWTPR